MWFIIILFMKFNCSHKKIKFGKQELTLHISLICFTILSVILQISFPHSVFFPLIMILLLSQVHYMTDMKKINHVVFLWVFFFTFCIPPNLIKLWVWTPFYVYCIHWIRKLDLKIRLSNVNLMLVRREHTILNPDFPPRKTAGCLQWRMQRVNTDPWGNHVRNSYKRVGGTVTPESAHMYDKLSH